VADEPAPGYGRLSRAAAAVYGTYLRGPAPAREVRRSLPIVLSRREYSRAWCELARLGLVPASSTSAKPARVTG